MIPRIASVAAAARRRRLRTLAPRSRRRSSQSAAASPLAPSARRRRRSTIAPRGSADRGRRRGGRLRRGRGKQAGTLSPARPATVTRRPSRLAGGLSASADAAGVNLAARAGTATRSTCRVPAKTRNAMRSHIAAAKARRDPPPGGGSVDVNRASASRTGRRARHRARGRARIVELRQRQGPLCIARRAARRRRHDADAPGARASLLPPTDNGRHQGSPTRNAHVVNARGFPVLPPKETLPNLIREGARAAARRGARGARRGTWTPTSSARLLERVENVACAIRDAGLAAGDRVALISHNCVDWIVCDFATFFAGCVVVPIYPTQALDHMAYILEHSGARLLFVDSAATLERLRDAGASLPRDRPIRFARRRRSRRVRSARRRGASCAPRASRRVRGDAAARRPRSTDLHVGHDRATQGRHALARQSRV